MYKTRKDFIVAKYEELNTYLNTHFNGSPFPTLNEIDPADVVYLITSYFSPLYEEQNYAPTIKELIDMYNIKVDDETFNKHYPFIKEKINEFIEFFKSQY